MAIPAVKVQSWGDDLRLPSLLTAPTTLLGQLEQYRKISLPLQSKHLPSLKRNSWFALRRPADKSRTGLIVLWPENSCCIFLPAEQPAGHRRPPPAAALLRLRVDPQFFAPDAGITVFAATLSAAARRLWVEDVFLWKGRDLMATEPFHTRLRLAAQWLEHYCMLDARLLGGLEMELAAWAPLDTVEPEGAWELLQADSPGARRLFWLARRRAVAATVAPDTIQYVPAAPHAPTPSGPPVAVATRESGPDQWSLSSADGVSLGRALIRTMQMSTAMRQNKTNAVRVVVEWIGSFGKWEIKELAPAGATASHSGFFDGAK
jgi:hypothetical protein